MHHDDADDLDVENRLVVLVHFDLGDPLHDVNARLDAPEDCVFVVEPRRGDGGDEELRAVGVLARISHREHARAIVDVDEVFTSSSDSSMWGDFFKAYDQFQLKSAYDSHPQPSILPYRADTLYRLTLLAARVHRAVRWPPAWRWHQRTRLQ